MKKIPYLLSVLLGASLFFSLFSCRKCEHEWKDATCTTAKTCTKCGITEGEPLGHSWKEATCTTPKTCTRCGVAEGIALGHTYGDWIVDREATETEVGAKHRICSGCEKQEDAEIPMLTHTHKYSTEWSYDDAYHWHASTCGHDDAVADKAPHDFGDTGICECGARETNIAVTVYIDGVISDTLHTGKSFGYRITPPEKPEDITTNPNSEKYFYAWFVDANFQTPLLDETEFRANATIYGKWVTVYSNDFKYTVSEGKATITSLSVAMTSTTTLVIPAYINGFPVVAIGESAFSGNTFIRTLILCNGIHTIGTSAFSGCNSITHLELPKSLVTIGNSAFENCSTLTEVLIPENVTSIGGFAFSDCSGLTSVAWNAENCTSAGSYNYPIFNGCTKLATATFGEKVKNIPSYAFFDCSWLTSVTIPSSVTMIGFSAFENCTRLMSITLPFVGATKDGTIDTNFGYIFGAHLPDYNDQYVPSSLEAVVITGGTNIAKCGFLKCSRLASITIPNSVTSIGDSAFSSCSGLTSITIPNSVITIDSYAFENCSGLTSITIPGSVISIGSSAFSGCSGLTSIQMASENRKYHSDGNCLIETATKTLILGCKNSIIPSDGSVIEIASSAFAGCTGLTSITIPEGVTTIGGYAFYWCMRLTSIEIPNSVTTIGRCAFSGCSRLTSIEIPNSVTTIGDSAFWGCTGLASITIGNSVTTIGDSAFKGCTGLKDIYYTGTESEWNAISKGDGWNMNTGNYTIHYNYTPESDEG